MTAPLGLPEASDAELVALVLQAARDAFATIYDRYGPRLYDFAYSMLRQREDAADSVADAFVTFAEKLSQLREPDRLRPWLYAIVRSECLRRLKQRKRVSYGDDEQLAEMADDAMTPDEAAEKAALTKLVWDAAAGLADRDRALLDLHLRQGLEGADLGEAMGVSASNAYVMLNRLKTQVDRSLGALLIARLGREECDELDALLGDWDGSFSPLIRKRVARHVDGCSICGDRRKRIVSPWMLLAGVPVFVAPAALRDRVVNDTQLVAFTTPGGGGAGGGAAAAAPGETVAPRRRIGGRVLAAAALALVVIGGGAALVWSSDDDQVASSDDPVGLTTPTGGGLTLSPAPSATEEPTATAGQSATSSTSASPKPGAIALSAHSLDFGKERTKVTLRLGNIGDLSASFKVTSAQKWLAVTPPTGLVAGGDNVLVTVTADRSALAEGTHTGSLAVRWPGGTASVKVSLIQEINPLVGTPQLGRTSCTAQGRTFEVSVNASDSAGIRTVKLFWSGANGGSVTMTRSGSVWTATMGPFPVGGQVQVHATAIDDRGNIGQGPVLTTTVDPCPQ